MLMPTFILLTNFSGLIIRIYFSTFRACFSMLYWLPLYNILTTLKTDYPNYLVIARNILKYYVRIVRNAVSTVHHNCVPSTISRRAVDMMAYNERRAQMFLKGGSSLTDMCVRTKLRGYFYNKFICIGNVRHCTRIILKRI